jgi:hypothetical protein
MNKTRLLPIVASYSAALEAGLVGHHWYIRSKEHSILKQHKKAENASPCFRPFRTEKASLKYLSIRSLLYVVETLNF